MKKRFSSTVMGLALLMTVVLPPFIYSTLHASSMATGVLLVSIFYICSYVVIYPFRWAERSIKIFVWMVIAPTAAIFFQGLVIFSISPLFDLGRFLQSQVFFILNISGALSFVYLVRQMRESRTDFIVKCVFYTLFLSGWIGVLQNNFSSGGHSSKELIFFGEPSHFALSYLPFFLYMMIFSDAKKKLFLLIASFLMAFLMENLTFVAGATFIALMAFPVRRLLVVISVAAILVFNLNLSYYSNRLDISSSNQNLSVLVYLQGWERAYLNFFDSYGFGVGFQQFGIIGDRGKVMDDVVQQLGEPINLLDGGSVASKLIGEFGMFSIAALLAYFLYFFKSIRRLRSAVKNRAASGNFKEIFFLGCFVMYSIDLFVRGTGYFSPSGFLFVASMGWMAYGAKVGSISTSLPSKR